MTARPSFVLPLVVLLSGCSLFHKSDPTPATTPSTPTPAAAKKSALWPFGKSGPRDATPYIEYERIPSEKDPTVVILTARNTNQTKSMEGDIRTTIETAPNQTKVDGMHFTLAPNETKELLAYPKRLHLTYEVSAFFKE